MTNEVPCHQHGNDENEAAGAHPQPPRPSAAGVCPINERSRRLGLEVRGAAWPKRARDWFVGLLQMVRI